MAQPLVPSTAFDDAWIQVDRTEDPRFFVNLLDATRARLLEQARKSPTQFFTPLAVRPGLNVLDVGCGTGDFLRLLAPIVSPGKAVGLDLSETMIAEASQRSQGAPITFRSGWEAYWISRSKRKALIESLQRSCSSTFPIIGEH